MSVTLHRPPSDSTPRVAPARKLAEPEPPRHPSSGGMKPAGRPAASGPLNNEPRCPAGPSLQCIPVGFIAASSEFDMSSQNEVIFRDAAAQALLDPQLRANFRRAMDGLMAK